MSGADAHRLWVLGSRPSAILRAVRLASQPGGLQVGPATQHVLVMLALTLSGVDNDPCSWAM